VLQRRGRRHTADRAPSPDIALGERIDPGEITVPTSWGDGGRGRRSGPRSLGQSHCSIPGSAQCALHSCAISAVMRSRPHKGKFMPCRVARHLHPFSSHVQWRFPVTKARLQRRNQAKSPHSWPQRDRAMNDSRKPGEPAVINTEISIHVVTKRLAEQQSHIVILAIAILIRFWRRLFALRESGPLPLVRAALASLRPAQPRCCRS
jgi:hypothetical protein